MIHVFCRKFFDGLRFCQLRFFLNLTDLVGSLGFNRF
jgi:hypothetical protein